MEEYYVLGGTEYDSSKGVQQLLQHRIQAQAIGISSTPSEQAVLHSNPQKLETRVRKLLTALPPRPCLIYCNSLSFSLDWDNLDLPGYNSIQHLRPYYTTIAADHDIKALGVLVADDLTLERVIKNLQNNGYQGRIEGVAALELVEQLEHNPVRGQKMLKSIMDNFAKKNLDLTIIGCTHFDDSPILNRFKIPLAQPGLQMISSLSQSTKLG